MAYSRMQYELQNISVNRGVSPSEAGHDFDKDAIALARSGKKQVLKVSIK